MMRWPWSREPETRSYEGIILEAVESAVATSTSGSISSAVEVASGFLARELQAATVEGPEWAKAAITPEWLGYVARSAVREGESVSVIMVKGDRILLLPTSDHDWRSMSDPDEMSWTCRASVSVPHGTTSREYARSELAVVRWAVLGRERHRGRSAASLSGSAASAAKKSEDRLSDEMNLPTAGFLVTPDNVPKERFDEVKSSVGGARGKVFVTNTTKGGAGNPHGAPARDWDPTRLKPTPDAALVKTATDSFNRMLAAIGMPPALADPGADGTAQREALRRARLNLVEPFCRALEFELSMQMETPIKLRFDSYALDMQARSTTVAKLVAAGVDVGVAMNAVGLNDG